MSGVGWSRYIVRGALRRFLRQGWQTQSIHCGVFDGSLQTFSVRLPCRARFFPAGFLHAPQKGQRWRWRRRFRRGGELYSGCRYASGEPFDPLLQRLHHQHCAHALLRFGANSYACCASCGPDAPRIRYCFPRRPHQCSLRDLHGYGGVFQSGNCFPE